ncbi:CRISPR-associated protein Cas4, partial [bacterium]|nr:CRISPR-associated protein Cas4 [bacterium]
LPDTDYKSIVNKLFSLKENIDTLYSLFRRELTIIWNSDIPYTMLDKFEYDEIFAKNFIKKILEIQTEILDRDNKSIPAGFEVIVKKEIEIGNKRVSIKGRIDRIDIQEDGKISIIDYKTGKKFKKENTDVHLIKSKDEFQLQIYAYLLTEYFDAEIDRLIYVTGLADWNGPYWVSMKYNEEIHKETREKINELLKLISKNEFPPAQKSEICKNCEYNQYCSQSRYVRA